MKKIVFSVPILTILHIAPALAVSYECEINGKLILQREPCEGVKYEKNVTTNTSGNPHFGNEAEYGWENLGDSLAVTGTARYVANHGAEMVRARNQQLQAEQQIYRRYNYERNKAEEWRILEQRGKMNNDAWLESFSRHQAQEHEQNAREME